MDIKYVINAKIPSERAHSYQVCKMCEEFSKMGHNVELVVPFYFRNINVNPFEFYSINKIFNIRKLPVVDLTFLKFSWTYKLLMFSFLVSSYLYLLFCKGKFVVYCRGEVVLSLSLLPRKVKVFWETHIKTARFDIYKKSLLRVSGIVVITNYFKKELVDEFRINPGKIIVSPDAVDFEKFNFEMSREEARAKLGLPLDKKILMYTGSDLNWKGLDVLKKAVAELPNDYLMVFVGKIKGDSDDKSLFVGYKKHDEIPLWLKAADLLILTGDEKSDISQYYTSPLKMFEYMASKRPILSFNISSFKDVLNNDNSFILKNNSVENIIEEIIGIMEDSENLERASLKALEGVKMYTWERRANNLVNFLI